jgi:hypothetical protein
LPGKRKFIGEIHSFGPRLANNHSILATFQVKVRRSCGSGENSQEAVTMLWTIFVILLVLWLLGVVSSYTLGGFIHILLVLAVVALVFQLISGRRPVV